MGLKSVVIGKTDANDDVIVHLNNGAFACAPLVWIGEVGQYPDKFSSFMIFENVVSIQIYLNDEADE